MAKTTASKKKSTATRTKSASKKKSVNATAAKAGKPIALCSGRYYAEQIPGAVLIHAHGYHNTSGYKVFFEKSPLAIFPPQYTLWHIKPSGPVLEVITPFSVSTSFNAAERVASVVINDADGKHSVLVEQVPDLKLKRTRQAHGAKMALAAAGGVPGGCLDLGTAGQIVQNSIPNGPQPIDKSLEEVGLISPDLRLAFRDDVFNRVLANGCHIAKEMIPTDAGTTLRTVRTILADNAS